MKKAVSLPKDATHRRLGAVGIELARLLSTLILLNAPFWLLANHMFVHRGLFSLDSALALLLLVVSPVLGAVAIGLSWASDLTMTASFTYLFTSPLEFMRSAAFARHINWTEFIELRTVVLAMPFALAALGLVRLQPQRLSRWTLIGALISLVLLDTLNGSSPFSNRDVRLLNANVVGSSMLAISRVALYEHSEADALTPINNSGGATEFEALLPGIIERDDSVLYILVESFGIHKSVAIRNWLTRQLDPPELASQYNLVQSQVQVNGGTTAGELRRLCGLQGSPRNLHNPPSVPCLPRRMANSGRDTLGLHGFSQNMFDRQRWWPLLGLQHIEFAEQLTPRVSRQCGGAFQGICDADLIGEAVAAAARPRSFVYALTLNTHLPIAPIPIPADLATLCATARTGDEVCMLVAQLGVLLRSIPRELLIRESRPYVVVTGDHPPPFVSIDSRTQFNSGVVPIFVLKPRSPSAGRVAAQPQ